MTVADKELAMKCTAVFHPVPPYTHERGKEAAVKFEIFKSRLTSKGVVLVPSGDTVTIRYFELTNHGVPRFPTYAQNPHCVVSIKTTSSYPLPAVAC